MKTYIRWATLPALALMLSFAPALRAADTSKSPMEPRISVVTLGVADLQKSYQFYKIGLGFPTTMSPEGGIILFDTNGTKLFLYPYANLALDIGIKADIASRPQFPGFTFIHLVRRKEEVAAVLVLASKSGGHVVKQAAATAQGTYTGYFADPDGYIWEVTYSDQLKFNPDGSVQIQ